MATSSSVKVVTWEGCLAVDKAASVREDLLSALKQYSQVVISISMLEYLDVSIIQLLRAAWLEAARTEKTLHLTGTLKPEVHRILTLSGFLRSTSDNAREVEGELLGAVKEQNT